MEVNNDYEKNFIDSEKYKEQMHQLDSSIHLLLNEFKKLYVITTMHPTNEEYQVQYKNVINNLSEILSKLFSISNDVQVNTDNINKEFFKLDASIKKEREKNKELKRRLGIVENENNAVHEMINDYKDIYDKRYLRNLSLLLSSIICILAISKIYKK